MKYRASLTNSEGFGEDTKLCRSSRKMGNLSTKSETETKTISYSARDYINMTSNTALDALIAAVGCRHLAICEPIVEYLWHSLSVFDWAAFFERHELMTLILKILSRIREFYGERG